MATEQVLHMNGGVEETSYANNSTIQKKVMMLITKHTIEESIRRLYYATNSPIKCLKVADLGCSSSPNALLLASNIIDVVDELCIQNLNDEPPMFQFFLNDLFGNDFNTMFKLLPDFHRRLKEEKGINFGPCFFNGTPGSFYGRLFPDNSIHFFHSSYSVHWLSKTPDELRNVKEPLNKGLIYLTNTSPPAVHKAYFAQFKEDFKLFLKSRSIELVPGGAMVLTLMSRDENELYNGWVVLGMALNDMVKEKLIEERKLDSFNVPMYSPTAEEIEQIIEEEGSFKIQRLETVTMNLVQNVSDDDTLLMNEIIDDARAEALAKSLRAVAEPILKIEFGEAIMDELFRRYKNKLVQFYGVHEVVHNNLVMHITKNT